MWGAPPPPRRQCWKVWSAKVGAKKTAISAQKRRSDISSALYLGGWGSRPEDEHQVYGRYFCTYRGEVPSRMLLINVLLGNVKVASMSQEHTQRSRPQPRSLSCPPPSVGQQPSPSSVLASSVTASGRSSRSSRSVGQGLQSDRTASAGRSAASLCFSYHTLSLCYFGSRSPSRSSRSRNLFGKALHKSST